MEVGVSVSVPIVLHNEIVATSSIGPCLESLAEKWQTKQLVVGNRTGSSQVVDVALSLGLSIDEVDEHLSTQQARSRFFHDHPPRGLLRFIPRGMLSPSVPIDDYAAIILGERYHTRLVNK